MNPRRRTLLQLATAAALPVWVGTASAQTASNSATKAAPASSASWPTTAGIPKGPEPKEWITLWPQGAPGAPNPLPREEIVERSKDPALTDRHIAGVNRPRMAVFRPAQPNGASLLLMPGGGYRRVVVDREGYAMARWLAARGVTVFVLFYRLPGDGWQNNADVALADAQRAMRTLRKRAAEWKLDPERIAAMGFSAGGHLCADLMTRHAARVTPAVDEVDTLSARPCLAAPIYPVVTLSAPHAHKGSRERLLGPTPSEADEAAHSPHRNVAADNCPVFLVHAEDDESVPPENSLKLRAALREKKVPVELHLFTQGGHGFGLRKAIGLPLESWPELFWNWGRSRGWV
jgi:acetyl esterase/lipase